MMSETREVVLAHISHTLTSKAGSEVSDTFQLLSRTSVRILYKLCNMSPRLLRYWLRVWSFLGGATLLLLLVVTISLAPSSTGDLQGFLSLNLIDYVTIIFSLFCIV